jgi:hypothetical protein
MYWYKVRTQDEEGEGYTYVGTANEAPDELAQKAARGEFVRLDNLLYMDRGDVKDWAEWDKSLVPTVFINPSHIFSFMQFHGDPRSTPRK